MQGPQESSALPVGWLGSIVKAAGAWHAKTWRAPASRQMQILETLTLGPKKQLVLVRCGDRQFLVGTGAESVQTIVCIAGDAS